MAKPRRETKQLFYDTFADFNVDDQALVLDFLAELHRQAKRQAARLARAEAPADSVSGAAVVGSNTQMTLDGAPLLRVEDVHAPELEHGPEDWNQ